MVFPTGAQIWELAADRLDRLPGKSLIDGLVHKSSVAENDHARSTDEPEQRREGRREQAHGNGDDEETGPQLGGGGAEGTDLEITAVKLADEEHACNDEDDVEQQQPVGEQRVDAEHEEDDAVVAREVGEVVVPSRLDLAKVARLGEALHVEELADGAQVGEPSGQAAGAHAVEAVLDVQAGRQGVDGNLDASHCVGGGRLGVRVEMDRKSEEKCRSNGRKGVRKKRQWSI